MKLRDYLKDNGIKGSWLASKIPCSASHLSSLATERFFPSPIIIMRIEQLTDGKVTAADFERNDG